MEMVPEGPLRKRFGLKGGENVSIKYDDNGYPDFRSVRREPSGDALKAVETPEGGDVAIDYGKDRAEDNTKANKELVDQDLKTARKAGAAKKNDAARKRELVKKHSDGRPVYTWHHHEDGKSMILVDFWVHKLFGHSGGSAKR
ncbi:hypothetical protein PsAD2_03709 [Pseudovibrio axinellae]|uniref:Uncharacterized protein n=1 Tax=Pseudovibrio axinellae TaxID=989403 RepID=A0A165VU93_9HYPH|nr:HNH endonuclease [Pseudovibrio axinellae]KZL15453.1 hypothetical protein PsAD2_03709 [Pseudovibrio axinellae]SER89194.1 DNase/tRNase domain of colicin-like bacteriocin [Pseudovibrio axinellae]